MLKHYGFFGALAALAMMGSCSAPSYAEPQKPLAKPPERDRYPNAGKAVISPESLYSKSGTKRGKRAARRHRHIDV